MGWFWCTNSGEGPLRASAERRDLLPPSGLGDEPALSVGTLMLNLFVAFVLRLAAWFTLPFSGKRCEKHDWAIVSALKVLMDAKAEASTASGALACGDSISGENSAGPRRAAAVALGAGATKWLTQRPFAVVLRIFLPSSSVNFDGFAARTAVSCSSLALIQRGVLEPLCCEDPSADADVTSLSLSVSSSTSATRSRDCTTASGGRVLSSESSSPSALRDISKMRDCSSR
eukprot:PhM_4_TR13557/c0_g1_i1/m.83425